MITNRTSRPLDLKAPDWTTNAMGRRVSHSYGYGLMDATAMVSLARFVIRSSSIMTT